jgi:hypothetical protein
LASFAQNWIQLICTLVNLFVDPFVSLIHIAPIGERSYTRFGAIHAPR